MAWPELRGGQAFQSATKAEGLRCLGVGEPRSESMGGFSVMHWIVVLFLVLLLFGAGRFSAMMTDLAKGLRTFRQGLAEDAEGGKGMIGR